MTSPQYKYKHVGYQYREVVSYTQVSVLMHFTQRQTTVA